MEGCGNALMATAHRDTALRHAAAQHCGGSKTPAALQAAWSVLYAETAHVTMRGPTQSYTTPFRLAPMTGAHPTAPLPMASGPCIRPQHCSPPNQRTTVVSAAHCSDDSPFPGSPAALASESQPQPWRGGKAGGGAWGGSCREWADPWGGG